MKKENEYSGVLADIIMSLTDYAIEAKKDVKTAKKKEDKLFQEGRVLAYYEVLSTIKNRLKSYDIPLKKLDFKINPDKLLKE